MTLEIWITFVSVVFIFAIIPGPTVILVLGQSISHGKKSVIPLVSGVLMGDLVAMTLSLIGLGAVLATSATLFMILKWFGVGYLVYLGIKVWREMPERDLQSLSVSGMSPTNLFKSSFLVTALNPKDIVFFVAFLPQFVNPELAAVPQLLILMVTFLGVVSISITSFALFAGAVRHKIQSLPARRRLNRLGGMAMFGAAAFASTMQRS